MYEDDVIQDGNSLEFLFEDQKDVKMFCRYLGVKASEHAFGTLVARIPPEKRGDALTYSNGRSGVIARHVNSKVLLEEDYAEALNKVLGTPASDLPLIIAG